MFVSSHVQARDVTSQPSRLRLIDRVMNEESHGKPEEQNPLARVQKIRDRFSVIYGWVGWEGALDVGAHKSSTHAARWCARYSVQWQTPNFDS